MQRTTACVDPAISCARFIPARRMHLQPDPKASRRGPTRRLRPAAAPMASLRQQPPSPPPKAPQIILRGGWNLLINSWWTQPISTVDIDLEGLGCRAVGARCALTSCFARRARRIRAADPAAQCLARSPGVAWSNLTQPGNAERGTRNRGGRGTRDMGGESLRLGAQQPGPRAAMQTHGQKGDGGGSRFIRRRLCIAGILLV